MSDAGYAEWANQVSSGILRNLAQECVKILVSKPLRETCLALRYHGIRWLATACAPAWTVFATMVRLRNSQVQDAVGVMPSEFVPSPSIRPPGGLIETPKENKWSS